MLNAAGFSCEVVRLAALRLAAAASELDWRGSGFNGGTMQEQNGRTTGVIVGLNLTRGFGFVAANGRDKNVFFHVSSLAPDLAFNESLQERRVEFNIVTTDKGDAAVNIRPSE